MEISNLLENWPDRIINLRVTSPWLLKKPLIGFVITITHLVLIDFVITITHSVYTRSFWILLIRWTWMKSRISSEIGQIWSLELSPLAFDCWKASVWLCQHNSFSFDKIFLKLDKVDMEDSQMNSITTHKCWVWLCLKQVWLSGFWAYGQGHYGYFRKKNVFALVPTFIDGF